MFGKSLEKALRQPVKFQIALVTGLLLLFLPIVLFGPLDWDNEVSVASMIAIPAAVIAVTQLVLSNAVQRASYIKDYALKFRADKELTETFHYLIASYSNTDYEKFRQNPEVMSDLQKSLRKDLQYFDPVKMSRSPQERRIDNLLGFFDTLGYDYCRGLVTMEDIAGVFGVHMDHFLQRRTVTDYIETIKTAWPRLGSFHTQYKSPVPFMYFGRLCSEYLDYQKRMNPV